MSVFMMFRRRVIERIAPILPDLWTYCGNDYLCERARRLGWRCYYLAAARAVHYERHSNRELYSSDASSAYKRSSTPVSDRMLRDKFRFLRDLYSWPHVAAFRVIATFEFAIHIAALLRQPRAQRREALAKYLATIHALWSY
jgi:GT2 family glycosyltransferase